MRTVGLSACSNPLGEAQRAELPRLVKTLEAEGCRVLLSRCIREEAPSGQVRAEALMELFADPTVSEIYDISGGDMANEVLDWLDFDTIRQSQAVFWGYSDLTTVLNAIYAKTGKSGVLWQVRHMAAGTQQALQRRRYGCREELFAPEICMVQGRRLEGVVVGGNLRCFLKLAGTPFLPALEGKVLLMEARSGQVPQMVTYLAQLRSMGAFEKIRGVLLGTCSEMEARGCLPDMVTLVREFAGEALPIARTKDIGHGEDAKALWIGRNLSVG